MDLEYIILIAAGMGYAAQAWIKLRSLIVQTDAQHADDSRKVKMFRFNPLLKLGHIWRSTRARVAKDKTKATSPPKVIRMVEYRPPKNGRAIKRVFIHCSASNNPAHDNVETIRRWHVSGNGWSDIGYHYVITQDGTVHIGRPVEKMPAAQKGHNQHTIAICLTGLDRFSQDQFASLTGLCHSIRRMYGRNTVTFHGHCEVSSKRCPVFDYRRVLRLDERGRVS